MFVSRLRKSQRAELERDHRKKKRKKKRGRINTYLFLSSLSAAACVFPTLRWPASCASETSERAPPLALHQTRTNHNDFSAGEHPLQLSSPQLRLCKNNNSGEKKKPGKHFCMTGKGNPSLERFVGKLGHFV